MWAEDREKKLRKAMQEVMDWHRDRGTMGLYFDKPNKAEHRKMAAMCEEALK